MFPVLANFRHTSPCHRSNTDHGLQRELPTTGTEDKAPRTVEADSQLVNCSRISYQQVIRILHSAQGKQELTWLSIGPDSKKAAFNSQATLSPSQYHSIDKRINDSVQSEPAFPPLSKLRHTRLVYKTPQLLAKTCFQPQIIRVLTY
jgi:hypothetical protein